MFRCFGVWGLGFGVWVFRAQGHKGTGAQKKKKKKKGEKKEKKKKEKVQRKIGAKIDRDCGVGGFRSMSRLYRKTDIK